VNRRELMLLTAGAMAIPRALRAQQKTMPVIGYLAGGSGGTFEAGFRQGLKEFGYVDGQNVVVDYRFAEGQPDRIAGLATELMQLQPDVLAVVGTATMGAMRDMTGNIPVVLLAGDPVGAGFVASLARPGGHITGVSMMQGAGGLTGKRIELLKDALPAAGLYDRVLREVERPLILLTLTATRGNQIRAAQLLGLNRNTLRKKIRELDIEVMRGLR